MKNSPNSNLKTSSRTLKQIFPFENKHLVIIDESIIQKLGINDNLTTFVEQELTDDGIVMRIKKF
jgi:hypothetical protein